MITQKRNEWLAEPACPVSGLMAYIEYTDKMRDAQIDAIKTYLFLKIGCENKPLPILFQQGRFNNLDLNTVELSTAARGYLEEDPASAALLEYSLLANDSGGQVSEKLEKQIKKAPESIDYSRLFHDVFYGVTYTDYLFSLPMGAGKTYLMAAFIYIDLYYAMSEPSNPLFAHNFIILAPSGLKSSVVPSLRTIQRFDPSWVIPEPSATNLKRHVLFEVLDQQKTAKKSNRVKNPNVQKIANHQPLSELFALVAVTNAEKVILDGIQETGGQINMFEDSDDEKDRLANELRNLIGKLPSLSIFIDEVHHAVSDEIKLRAVVNRWSENNVINSVVGFSGTPYIEKTEKCKVTDELTIASAEISNVVYYYPLISGIGNFLKIPIIKISDAADSERIVEVGVREFLDAYKDTVYQGGLTAKLAVYCGTIPKLEEVIFPLVSRIVSDYGLSSDVILKFHKGDKNKKYPQPPDSQLEFDSLDKVFSKKRIVLLVQIGKEGWDCRSLTGVILSQESGCPRNMVLQTSCRCLRQISRESPETALIMLNENNAENLNAQLEQQHHISLKEFATTDNSKIAIKRYDRTEYLKLPPIQFYHLRIKHETLLLEDANPREAIVRAAENTEISHIVKTQDFRGNVTGVTVDETERGEVHALFMPWLFGITKASFGNIGMKQLNSEKDVLLNVFNRITYEKEGARYFSSKYDRVLIEANIRKGFYDKRTFSTIEELIPHEAKLLNIKNFSAEVRTDSPDDYYPVQSVVENIIDDDTGKLSMDAKTIQLLQLAEETGNTHIAEQIRNEYATHPAKNRSFHYLPYKTDSGFEEVFLRETLALDKTKELGLEVYFNGDRYLTEFRIRCYRFSSSKWIYIGFYTPDFLIIKRKDGDIYKAVIVETKGRVYASEPGFGEKRKFMETHFKDQNNEAFGYDRFDYLYLEDSLTEQERLIRTRRKIIEFFKEVSANA